MHLPGNFGMAGRHTNARHMHRWYTRCKKHPRHPPRLSWRTLRPWLAWMLDLREKTIR